MNRLLIPISVVLSLTVALGSCSQKITAAADATALPANSGAAATTPAPLHGTWTLTQLTGTAVASAEGEPTAQLIFDATTQRLSGSTGCNRLMGSYTATGNSLSFGQLATTRMACAGPNPEQSLLAALHTPGLTYQISANNQLTLLSGATAVAVFTRVGQ